MQQQPGDSKVGYTEEFKEYIGVLIQYCRDKTYSGEYQTIHNFHEDRHGVDEAAGTEDHMSISINGTYLYVTVDVYPIVFEKYQKKLYKDIAKDVLHEICHILIEPVGMIAMADARPSEKWFVRQRVERQTQRIANTVWDLMPKDWYLTDKMKEAEVVPKKKRRS